MGSVCFFPMQHFLLVYTILIVATEVLCNVEFTLDKTCYAVGGSAELTAKYTGSEQIVAVNWYYTNQTAGDLSTNTNCNVIIPDNAYPVSRMDFPCNQAASNIYFASIRDLEPSDFFEWGASFTLDVSGKTSTKKASITLCSTAVSGGLSGGAIAGIVIGVVFFLP